MALLQAAGLELLDLGFRITQVCASLEQFPQLLILISSIDFNPWRGASKGVLLETSQSLRDPTVLRGDGRCVYELADPNRVVCHSVGSGPSGQTST